MALFDEKLFLFSVNFENIIKKIFEIRDYQSVIILAKCLFEVNDNYKGNNLEDLRTKPFYFNNFKGTEFFEYLLKIEDQEAIYELVEFFIKEVIGKLIDKKIKIAIIFMIEIRFQHFKSIFLKLH